MASTVRQIKIIDHPTGSTSATTIATTFNSPVLAGSTLLALTMNLQGDAASSTISDSVNGAWNTTPIDLLTDTDPSAQTRLRLFRFENTAAGTPTVTATFSATTQFRGIIIVELDGVAAASLDKHTAQAQVNPGTGANAVTSGNTATLAGQPNIVIAFSMNTSGTSGPPNVGTGYTSQGVGWAWDNGFNTIRVESKNTSATTAVAGTFTATGSGADRCATFVVVLLDAAPTSNVSMAVQNDLPVRRPDRRGNYLSGDALRSPVIPATIPNAGEASPAVNRQTKDPLPEDPRPLPRLILPPPGGLSVEPPLRRAHPRVPLPDREQMPRLILPPPGGLFVEPPLRRLHPRLPLPDREQIPRLILPMAGIQTGDAVARQSPQRYGASAQIASTWPSIPGSIIPTVGAHASRGINFTVSNDPVVTPAITTQSGSLFVACVGRGNISNFTLPSAAPQDNKGNPAYSQVGVTEAYGPPFTTSGTALYSLAHALGGAGYQISVPQGLQSGSPDEVTSLVVEVVGGTNIHDFAWNEDQSAAPTTSASVTTTGPAVLVAFWWGEDPATFTSAAVSSGWTVIESFPVPASNAVQAAMAVRQVLVPGTYNITWTATPAQGAQMWIVAVQGGSLLPNVEVTVPAVRELPARTAPLTADGLAALQVSTSGTLAGSSLPVARAPQAEAQFFGGDPQDAGTVAPSGFEVVPAAARAPARLQPTSGEATTPIVFTATGYDPAPPVWRPAPRDPKFTTGEPYPPRVFPPTGFEISTAVARALRNVQPLSEETIAVLAFSPVTFDVGAFVRRASPAPQVSGGDPNPPRVFTATGFETAPPSWRQTIASKFFPAPDRFSLLARVVLPPAGFEPEPPRTRSPFADRRLVNGEPLPVRIALAVAAGYDPALPVRRGFRAPQPADGQAWLTAVVGPPLVEAVIALRRTSARQAASGGDPIPGSAGAVWFDTTTPASRARRADQAVTGDPVPAVLAVTIPAGFEPSPVLFRVVRAVVQVGGDAFAVLLAVPPTPFADPTAKQSGGTGGRLGSGSGGLRWRLRPSTLKGKLGR